MKLSFINKKCSIVGKRGLIYNAIVVVAFFLITIVYFAPAVFQGQVLIQGDVAGASGTGRDAAVYYHQTGKVSYWTNGTFCGMPTYQIAPDYPSTNGLSRFEKIVTLRWPFNILRGDSWLLFTLMVGFYIFMRSLNVRRSLSAIGSVGWAFSSYFIILVVAGHIWKLETLSFIPPTVAGLIWIYRRFYFKGFVVMSLFSALQIYGNHIQMSYYFGFLMLFIALAFIYQAIKDKQYKHLVKATSLCILAGLIGIVVNGTNLYHTYKYSKETMRGGSQLTVDNNTTHNEINKNGLSPTYITQWSYGKAETLTFLIPNLYGGASQPLGTMPNINTDNIPPMLKQYVMGSPAYWGDQPFTSGPVYVGALIFFLFLCSLFILKGPIKWALIGATVFSILLSWGHNFMPLTMFFIKYIPLYSKFRTVSSILVIAEFTIPTLAILALYKFICNPLEVYQKYRKPIIGVVSATILFLLLLILGSGSFFTFLSKAELAQLAQHRYEQIYVDLFHHIAVVRKSLLVADAWRSFFIIVVGIALLFGYYIAAKRKVNKSWLNNLLIALIGAVCLIDLWSVDRRYLSDTSFKDPVYAKAEANPETFADKQIDKDKGIHYRVANLALNLFNDATTSYRHRSIGGYSAVKLQRYQDLIDMSLSRQYPSPIYDMLDTKYFIVPDSTTGTRAILNPNAFGSAWFVKHIDWVNDANQEMSQLLHAKDLKNVAIIDKSFAKDIATSQIGLPDSTDYIKITKYLPNQSDYNVQLKHPRVAVFSDIYYPSGWHLEANGRTIPIIRANYLLRAALLPAGKYELKMNFDPGTIHFTEVLARLGLLAIAIMILIYIMVCIRKEIKQKNK